jgi:hypothetical protein
VATDPSTRQRDVPIWYLFVGGIIFIGELDALGRSRMPSAVGGYDEKEQTLNQLSRRP